jgi:type IV fimbrial biogenesis protein FimT
MSVRPRSRAFTLIEVMVVVAIAGILAILAVPSFQEMAVHYRAQEDARAVLMAMTRARALAQRENMPVRLVVQPDTAVYQTARFAGLTPEAVAASVRRNVTSFEDHSDTKLPATVKMTRIQYIVNGAVTSTVDAGPGAVLIFCSSSDSYFRDATTKEPVCRIGDLTSDSARIQFEVLGKQFHIRVNGALGSVDLRRGTL